VIVLTRLNGPSFALNPDLIERAESTPDTVLTLVDGSKYLVAESMTEVIARIRWYRASLIAAAGAFDLTPPDAVTRLNGGALTLIPSHRES
jgi:flagellar protein FlbD